jgi:hypothetical protein
MMTRLAACDRDPDGRGVGLRVSEQGAHRLHGDVQREREERPADQAQRKSLAALRDRTAELPYHHERARDLDGRVEAEADQCRRSGRGTGEDRDDALDQVVRRGRVREPAGTGLQRRAESGVAGRVR